MKILLSVMAVAMAVLAMPGESVGTTEMIQRQHPATGESTDVQSIPKLRNLQEGDNAAIAAANGGDEYDYESTPPTPTVELAYDAAAPNMDTVDYEEETDEPMTTLPAEVDPLADERDERDDMDDEDDGKPTSAVPYDSPVPDLEAVDEENKPPQTTTSIKDIESEDGEPLAPTAAEEAKPTANEPIVTLFTDADEDEEQDDEPPPPLVGPIVNIEDDDTDDEEPQRRKLRAAYQ